MATPRFGFTELTHQEVNGDVSFNETLRMLDALVQTIITELNLGTPPGSPVHGDMYTVGTPANWSGTPTLYDLAQYYNGTWYYYTPTEGWTLYDLDTSTQYTFNGTIWA